MRRLAWYTTVVLGTLSLVLLLWQFREAILLFLLSLALAAAVRPLLNYLSKYRLSPSLGLMLIYMLGLVILAVLFYTISGLLLREVQQAANDLPLAYERIKVQWPAGNAFQQAIAERLPPSPQLYETIAGEQGLLLVETVLGITSGFFFVLGQIVIVLVLSIYWSTDRARFERLWLSLLPAEQRVRARDIWRDMEAGVGAYIRSELIQGLLAGLLLGLGYWGLGLNYSMTLALASVLVGTIPVLGAILAAFLALLVGLASSSTLAIAAALYTLAIFLILELVVEPHFFESQRFSTLLLVLGMITLATDFGLIGLIMAPPLMVAIQLFFRQFVRQSVPVAVSNTLQIADLQERLAAVYELTSDVAEPLPPETMSMLDRLTHLIEKAEQELPEEPPRQPSTETPTPFPSVPTSASVGTK